MWTALRVAASGAQAQERALDVAANNLANLQTAGYRSRRAALVDQPPGPSIFEVPSAGGGISLTSESVGQGVQVGSIVTNLAPGVISATGRPLDIAIGGGAFMVVELGGGGLGYTRSGSLHADGTGRLVTAGGASVAGINLPPTASDLTISADGTITGRTDDGVERTLGRLRLARFGNPDGLNLAGQNVLVATAASGPGLEGVPGTDGFGALTPSALEGSNVDLADEMTRIIQAQRAYQINLRALRTIDEMLQDANNLRRA